MSNNDLHWTQKPVRMMRWDYIGDYAKITRENLDKLARSKKQDWHINCEWIVGTPGAAPGLAHLTTFKTNKFERYPGFEDFDCLREYLPYAHKYGIKLLVYLNMHWFSYKFASGHSDWQQLVPSGEPYGKLHPLYGNGTTFCVNSPWRDWAFEMITETMKTDVDGVFLDGPVMFPECCYCKYCKSKFRKLYKKAIPTKDWANPLWRKFIEFRQNSMAEFLKDAQKAVKKINVEGVIFLNAGGWSPGGWRVAMDIQKLDKHQDFNGAEAFFHLHREEQNPYASAMMAKYLSAGEKPAVVFTHHCMGSWHYMFLPEWEINLAIAQTVACGANPWIAIFDYAHQYDKNNASAVKEIHAFLDKNETYFTDTSSEARIALLSSYQTGTNYISILKDLYTNLGSGKEEGLVFDGGTGKAKIDWAKRKKMCEKLLQDSFYGYYCILTQEHLQFDVILDTTLTKEGLKKYDTVILPNSACLSSKQKQVLFDFVKKGGNLIASFESGFYDENGKNKKDNIWMKFLGISKQDGLFGVFRGENYKIIKEKIAGFGKNTMIERSPYALMVKPTSGSKNPIKHMNPLEKIYEPLKGESSYPALVISKHNKGKVIYFSELIGAFYGECKPDSQKYLIANIIKSITVNKLEIEAPSTVEVELRSQRNPDRLLIHLINMSGAIKRPITEIIPVYNVKIRLRCNAKKVHSLTNKQAIPFYKKGDKVEFKLSKLDFYDVIVVE